MKVTAQFLSFFSYIFTSVLHLTHLHSTDESYKVVTQDAGGSRGIGSRFTVRLIGGEKLARRERFCVVRPLFEFHKGRSMTQLICHLIGGPLINLIWGINGKQMRTELFTNAHATDHPAQGTDHARNDINLTTLYTKTSLCIKHLHCS